MKLNNENSLSNKSKPKILAYVQVIDATPKDMEKVSKLFTEWKEKGNHNNIEFLLTDQQISLHSVDYLLNMLKGLKNQQRNEIKNDK